MSIEKKVELAKRLLLLGVSHDGVVELLWKHPLQHIEAQLEYLPYRKAKRPEAMIIESIRKNYSPPKEFYYARSKSELTEAIRSLDKGSEPSTRRATPELEGYGAQSTSDLDSADEWMATRQQSYPADLQDFDEADGSRS